MVRYFLVTIAGHTPNQNGSKLFITTFGTDKLKKTTIVQKIEFQKSSFSCLFSKHPHFGFQKSYFFRL